MHWIQENSYESNSAAFACRRFRGAHTFDKAAEMIGDIHTEFDVKDGKIVKTVTDNGSNMVKAFKIYGIPG